MLELIQPQQLSVPHDLILDSKMQSFPSVKGGVGETLSFTQVNMVTTPNEVQEKVCSNSSLFPRVSRGNLVLFQPREKACRTKDHWPP